MANNQLERPQHDRQLLDDRDLPSEAVAECIAMERLDRATQTREERED